MSIRHARAEEIHKGAYIQSADPEAADADLLQPRVLWVDTTSTPHVLKKRNEANDGWDDLAHLYLVDLATQGELDAEESAREAADLALAAALSPAYSALTDGATVTWDFDGAKVSNKTLTLGGNRTLDITNMPDGAHGTLVITQDGTGSRTLALPAGSKVVGAASAGVLGLSTAAGSIDVVGVTMVGSTLYFTLGKAAV